MLWDGARQVAVAFAAMHDTPARMAAVGVLRGVVPWAASRAFFATRLRRRCATDHPVFPGSQALSNCAWHPVRLSLCQCLCDLWDSCLGICEWSRF